MRVLVFGAGASKAAGYPLASELMVEIGRFAEEQPQNTSPGTYLQWMEWCRIRDEYAPPLSFLLKNPNPEVVLSTLDLFEAGIRAYKVPNIKDPNKLPQGKEAERFSESFDERWKAVGIGRPALEARQNVVQCLHNFFRHMHHSDAGEDGSLRSAYLRELLSTLVPGDTVITFNWDALAERILGQLGHWTPLDGYSLDKRHLRLLGKPLSGPRRSAIKVLKLHGSIGWYWNPERRFKWAGPPLLLDGYTFLRDIGFPSDSEPFGQFPESPLSDPESLLSGMYLHRPVMIYPTFLKRIADAEFNKIWHEAARSLEQASRVEIYGYSLPASDGAARTLFNSLRFRVASKKVSVMVMDPNKDTLRIWKAFLGVGIERKRRALG